MAEEWSFPSVLERMWGREPTTRRGPRPRLDLPTITAAAIEIADAEGIGGVSMASVASRVGVATTALYRYIDSKEDLLTAMADAVAPLPPDPEGMHWRDYLALWTRAQRDILLQHSWLLAISANVPPMGPRRLLWLDRALAALEGTGLDEGERVNVASSLTGFALTDASLIHNVLGDSQLDKAGLKGASDYGEALAAVLDPADYPALSAAVGAGVFSGVVGWVDDGDFLFGLNLLLDGVEQLIARRRAGT
ncbi:TetR/AcrR family transcriptional regulator [Sinosporangium siamense]|uniref:TetR family transcriptional regulator n=1 Tax=Sinosporangium siamense TaxID=1367973 RepID=A0A919RMB8_9ACTN|nr:TetR/AcrR family transcriptional regulator [Sinosporangium siamense]GII96203.1 TetR family transcriptional regulator [Sinosporangium siamense]